MRTDSETNTLSPLPQKETRFTKHSLPFDSQEHITATMEHGHKKHGFIHTALTSSVHTLGFQSVSQQVACTQQNTLNTKRQPARKKVEKKKDHDTKSTQKQKRLTLHYGRSVAQRTPARIQQYRISSSMCSPPAHHLEYPLVISTYQLCLETTSCK
jgi:hypothetical protein